MNRKIVTAAAALLLVGPSIMVSAQDAEDFVVLHNFPGLPGSGPAFQLARTADGSLYGTRTVHSSGASEIFRLDPAGNFEVLHTVDSWALAVQLGMDPSTSLVEGNDGYPYGAMRRGGSSDSGVIYRITKDGEYSVVHTFGFPDEATAGPVKA